MRETERDPVSTSQTVTARSLLVAWANEQDSWVRQLASEVVVGGKTLIASQIDAAYQTFLREKALVGDTFVSVSKLGDDASAIDAGSGLCLTKIRELKNVNALAGGQSIEFNPKLTVIFGENACGKTGYVRVLKKAAAVRTTEAVLPDVSQTQGTKQPPSARIGYRLGQEQPQEIEWKDHAGLAPFNRIDVFDSRAAALHVDGDLNYIYTPGELARFPLVQQGIEGVRSRLEQDVSARVLSGNPFLIQFDRQSRIYPLIDSLGASTDLAQLKALSTVSEAEQKETATLKTEIEALQTTNPAAQLKLAEAAKQNLEAVNKAFSGVGRFDVAKYGQSLEQLRRAETQYERATQESYAGLPIPGLLKEEWRRFIQAGDAYLKTLENSEKYPGKEDECLYCRQPLPPEAVALLRKYRDYCNNDLRTDMDSAARNIDAMKRAFQQSINIPDIERRLDELASNGGVVPAEKMSTLYEFISSAKAILDAVEARKSLEGGRSGGPYIRGGEDSGELTKRYKDFDRGSDGAP